MKDANFLKENNARHLWHPMSHPAESVSWQRLLNLWIDFLAEGFRLIAIAKERR